MAGPVSSRIPLRTGLTYHYLEWGPNTATAGSQPENGAQGIHTVILLHGFLDFAWTWEEVVRTGLLDRYRLIAPDLRGYGDSDRVGAGGYYHFFDYLADVHDLIEQLVPGKDAQGPLPKVSIVGHSMGGAVASYYAGSFPERVSRLVLLEGLGPPEKENPQDGVPQAVRTWLAAWHRVRQKPLRPMKTLEEAAERLRQHDSRLDAALALRLAAHGTLELPDGRRIFKHDPLHLTPGPYPYMLELVRAFWSRITCPLLLVSAEESEFRYTDKELARRQGFFTAARLKTATLPGSGHMMQRHQPAALARLLAEFLTSD